MSEFPIEPPVAPMLAQLAREIPTDGEWLYEPKWDGFRALAFRAGPRVYLQSRDARPLDRYFPELAETFRTNLPDRCVLDGEIVIAGPAGLDFDALQLRLHPAASRVQKLARETPAAYVAFDLLALDDRDLRAAPQADRRETLARVLGEARAPMHLTPCTRDPARARDWFARFEGAGLDGVVAKPAGGAYQAGRRAMLKIKHERTADCAVGGFRWHKVGPGAQVGSLLLGLYDDAGALQHVGVCSSFPAARRVALAAELAPLRAGAFEGHPWRSWADAEAGTSRMPGAQSRWSAGKDLSWEPVGIERVCEVRYDHLQRDRFRHATTFLRWRPDRRPESGRFDQLEVVAPYELRAIFGG